MNKLYEVQENTLTGWVNTWSDDNGATTFDSPQDAQAELDWFLQEMLEEVNAGNMEDAPNADDFRIVPIKSIAK